MLQQSSLKALVLRLEHEVAAAKEEARAAEAKAAQLQKLVDTETEWVTKERIIVLLVNWPIHWTTLEDRSRARQGGYRGQYYNEHSLSTPGRRVFMASDVPDRRRLY